MKFISFILFLFYSQLSYSNYYPDDRPAAGESFPSFFSRVTRGGGFPGVRLNPPEIVQNSFLKRILKSFWVGPVDKERAQLEKQGINIWQELYKTSRPFKYLFSDPIVEKIFENKMEVDHLSQVEWEKLSVKKREIFLTTVLFDVKDMIGKTLFEHLTDEFQVSSQEAIKKIHFNLLAHEDFVAKVRELGYSGPIYFRGITAPDPQNPEISVVVLDNDSLSEGSPFSSPVLKTIEMISIAAHEIAHCLQDQRGRFLKSDVQVRSADQALIIEGMAEHIAEKSIQNFGSQLKSPNAIKLGSFEQGDEIINRPGQESQGNLFPYTVGLPFVASLYDLKIQDLTDSLIRFLGSEKNLQHYFDSAQ